MRGTPFLIRMSKKYSIIGMLSFFILGCTCDFGLDSFGQSNAESKPGGPIAVVFHLDGAMPHYTDSAALLQEPGMSQEKFEKLMKKARQDILVQEIILHFSAFQMGFARTQEIGEIIARTAKEKPVTCVLEAADNKSYWMAASVCPKIILAPAGGLDIIGLSMESVYLKELLDKLGIQADMLAVGKYKSAAENVTRNDMSADAREAAESLLKDINNRFISAIATGRKINKEKVIQLIDSGPYTAVDAKKHGLVDEVDSIATVMNKLSKKYKGGVRADYGKKPPKEMDFSDLMKLLSGGGASHANDDTPKIAIIPAIGSINSGKNAGGMLSGSQAVYDIELIDFLQKAAADESVKAVVLHIDSPGGSALASDNIWEAIRIVAAEKPVVASMGDVAASGGYYIASAADFIYAGDNTITGSIGVVGGKMVLGDGLNHIGVHSDAIRLGKNAGMMSPFQPFTETEQKVILRSMETIYELFLKRVSEGRSLKTETVRKYAEGRIWTGAQAKKYKLVDELGSITDAIKKAKELADVEGVEAVLYPPPKTFMETLGEQLTGDDVRIQLAREFESSRRALELGALLKRETVLTFCPYVFSIE
ncbi:MAG: signal peptide peptidase SppA [Deltaproteobacteria bacterium]|nr:signal peptide peptidase SppA [Deltaproteobacteria bacterium]MBN2673778.1 signal peptide peptidase SppA [Deltaproteobacteria bacterium]